MFHIDHWESAPSGICDGLSDSQTEERDDVWITYAGKKYCASQMEKLFESGNLYAGGNSDFLILREYFKPGKTIPDTAEVHAGGGCDLQ